jgi:hypothetical protein
MDSLHRQHPLYHWGWGWVFQAQGGLSGHRLLFVSLALATYSPQLSLAIIGKGRCCWDK